MVTFLIRVRSLDAVTANKWLGLIVVVTGFVGTFLGGVIGDALERRIRHGYLWLSAISMLVATPLVYVALTAPSPSVYWAALAIADFLLFLSTSPINAVIVADVAPMARAAAMAASILAIHALGDGILADHHRVGVRSRDAGTRRPHHSGRSPGLSGDLDLGRSPKSRCYSVISPGVTNPVMPLLLSERAAESA